MCDLTSDHSSVLLEIMEQPTSTLQHPSLSTGPINWEKFSTQLENGTNLKVSL